MGRRTQLEVISSVFFFCLVSSSQLSSRVPSSFLDSCITSESQIIDLQHAQASGFVLPSLGVPFFFFFFNLPGRDLKVSPPLNATADAFPVSPALFLPLINSSASRRGSFITLKIERALHINTKYRQKQNSASQNAGRLPFTVLSVEQLQLFYILTPARPN